MKPTGQSRKMSLAEVCLSTAIGFFISLVVQIVAMGALHIQASMGKQFWLTAIFTVVSVLRGYFVRRLFNWLDTKYDWR